jgi:ketosteroid isomerase-like protein
MKLRTPVAPEDLAAVRTWFEALANHCRGVDYEGARPIFADDLIAFGTFADFMHGRELTEQKQWRNVWGTIRNFRFTLDTVKAIVSADRLTAIGMGVWNSDGFYPNGDRFDRGGRATVGLGRQKIGDPIVATHTHLSLNRGTPDQSYGKFGGP